MKTEEQRVLIYPEVGRDRVISRRSAVGSSGLLVLGLLSGPAFGQMGKKQADTKTPLSGPPAAAQADIEMFKSFDERLHKAKTDDERRQINNEMLRLQHQRAFEALKSQLQLSDQEWAAVKPRLQAVYDLVRPLSHLPGESAAPKTEVEQKSRELREVLRDDKADMGQIKAKLAAYRAAKAKANQELAAARQNLRQIMNVRQEAVLVLNGLLD